MIYIFEIIFRSYKLDLLYKTNAKRKKKEENFLYLNILRNSGARPNVTSVIFS